MVESVGGTVTGDALVMIPEASDGGALVALSGAAAGGALVEAPESIAGGAAGLVASGGGLVGGAGAGADGGAGLPGKEGGAPALFRLGINPIDWRATAVPPREAPSRIP